jgi:hypothetical protein
MRRALVALLLATASAQAAPFNTWGVHVGEGVVGSTTYVYGREIFAASRHANPIFYGEFGVTQDLELDVGIGTTVDRGLRAPTLELLVRSFVAPSTALVVRGALDRASETLTLSPELHGVYTFPSWDLTVNAGWSPHLGPGTSSAGGAALTIAPEHYWAPGFSSFVEVVGQASLDDARFPRGGRLYAELVPGVALRFGAMHEVCMGLGLPVAGASLEAAYVGVWYAVASSGVPVRVR